MALGSGMRVNPAAPATKDDDDRSLAEPDPPEEHRAESESGGFVKRHRRALLAALGAAAIVGFIYYVVPQIAGLGPTLHRLQQGSVRWLALGSFWRRCPSAAR
jgi:hypothetical protein